MISFCINLRSTFSLKIIIEEKQRPHDVKLPKIPKFSFVDILFKKSKFVEEIHFSDVRQ
jgi:hypothetical protein